MTPTLRTDAAISDWKAHKITTAEMVAISKAEGSAMQRFEAAALAKREEMHGANWAALDWYGRPLEAFTDSVRRMG